jgi:hypothetical protein
MYPAPTAPGIMQWNGFDFGTFGLAEPTVSDAIYRTTSVAQSGTET